jgi:AcrR family transcriptional regulator
MSDGAPARRAYNSASRQARAEERRRAILDVLVEQLADGTLDELSMPKAAARAGVSLRTAYLYFPNQEAQLEAVARFLDGRIVGDLPNPRSVEELPALARALYHAFGASEALVRAQAAAGIARDVRRRRRRERLASIDAAVAALDCPPRETRWASSLIKHLLGADAGIALKDEFGLEPEEAGEAVAWAVEALIGRLRGGSSDG